jgi:hypothetical protein
VADRLIHHDGIVIVFQDPPDFYPRPEVAHPLNKAGIFTVDKPTGLI